MLTRTGRLKETRLLFEKMLAMLILCRRSVTAERPRQTLRRGSHLGLTGVAYNLNRALGEEGDRRRVSDNNETEVFRMGEK